MMSCFNKIMPGRISAATTAAIACLGFTVLPYAAYSLDLPPSNLRLLPKLREDLWGQHFSSDEEAKDAVCQGFEEKRRLF